MHKRLELPILILYAGIFIGMFLWVALHRLTYPLDLEWMEGGMLMHAVRIAEGKGIYLPPTTEFVPYFYTPGYPVVLALLGGLFDLGYPLARSISLLASIGTSWLMFSAVKRESSWQYGVLAVGLYAALFRTNGAFYDIARPDSLFLFFVFGALYVTRFSNGVRGAVFAGVLCALGFLTKQTASVFFVAICVVQVTRSWREAVACAGAGILLAVGGCGLLNLWSDGWFWTYIFEGHQGHVFIWNNILLEYWRDLLFLAPVLLLLPLVHFTRQIKFKWLSWVLVAHWAYAFWVRTQSLDYSPHMYYRELWYESPRYLILIPPVILGLSVSVILLRLKSQRVSTSWVWLWFFVAGCGVSALNHSTQWAYANCFMPISIVGSVLIALTIRDIFKSSDRWSNIALMVAMSTQCAALFYFPSEQIPTKSDRGAYQELAAVLEGREGPVLALSNPFLAYQSQGTFHTHRMGLQDVAFLGGVKDFFRKIRGGVFQTLVLSEGDRIPGLESNYYRGPIGALEERHSLRMKTGYLTKINALWFRRDEPEWISETTRTNANVRKAQPERWLTESVSGTFETPEDFVGWVRKGDAFKGKSSQPHRLYPRGRQGKFVMMSGRESLGEASITLKPLAGVNTVRGIQLLAGGTCRACRVVVRDREGVLVERKLPRNRVSLNRVGLKFSRPIAEPITLSFYDNDQSGALAVDDIRLAR